MRKPQADIRNGKAAKRQDSVLDAIDRRILERLQRDSTISNRELAEQVGLSPPACLKRVRALRVAGVITSTVAVLSPELLGYPMLTVARVKLELPNEAASHAFEAHMAKLPRVVQCMTVAGDFDYILLIRSRDVGHYQDFARKVLKLAPGIRSYTSEIVLQVHKATTALPIDPPGMAVLGPLRLLRGAGSYGLRLISSAWVLAWLFWGANGSLCACG